MDALLEKIKKIADVVQQQVNCDDGGAEVSLKYRSYGPKYPEERPDAKLWSFDVGGG